MSPWGFRESTKPSALQENARKVAMDAFTEGRMADGKLILEVERTRLSKPQAKQIAKRVADQGRIDDAMQILMMSMGKSQAERELAPPPTARVGDILYSSWGYDQTQIDYFEVVAVSGASATIRKIGKRRLPSSDQYSDQVVAVPGNFIGPPKKKRVQKSSAREGYEIKVNDHHAWLWDGKPLRETASGYGH